MPTPTRAPAARIWPLVGRDRELRELSAALDDPACGGVALVGPAGVGKTRLGQQMAELASLRGLLTVAIRASRSASNIPFAALAPLFSELGVRPDDDSTNPFQAVAAALGRRRGQERLVLIVDDAKDLDSASAAVLDQFLGSGETFVVVTMRTGEGAEPLVDLWTDGHLLRVQVDPLPPAETKALIATALGGPVDGGALQALVSASGGNVLYLRELVQGALESATLSSHRGLWRLEGSLVDSPRLRDLIDHRLGGLSAAELEAIELVALGEPLELELLATLVTHEIIEGLERRGLLDAANGESGPQVRLAHPLYGEAVRAHLSPVRRVRLCRSLADVAEQGDALNAPNLLRVALWRLDGGGGNAEGALAAAQIAFRSGDFELAARLARSAWEKSRLVGAAITLVDALDATSHDDDVEQILREALRLTSTDGERTAVACRLASLLFVWRDRVEEADDVLASAATEMASASARREVVAQRADHMLLMGNVARAIELDLPLLSDDTDQAFIQASRDIGVAFALAGRTTEAIAHTEAALSARQEMQDVDQVAPAAIFLVARALACTEAGRFAEAVAIAEAGYATSVERKSIDGQAWFAAVLGHALCTQGRLAAANHLYRETATIFIDVGHPGRRWGLGGIALTAGQLNDRSTATAAIAELEAVPATAMRIMDVHIERGRAWAHVTCGKLSEARAVLWSAVELAEGWGQYASAAAALHDLVRLDDGVKAARRLDDMRDTVDGVLMVARASHARAVLTGEPGDATLAVDRFEGCGAFLLAAEAAALEYRLATAAGLHRRAASAATRAEALVALCDGARTPALLGSSDRVKLSARELEVALLAADGLASREIAERLFVSSRTVDNHLQRAYMKLGVTGRAELAGQLKARSIT